MLFLVLFVMVLNAESIPTTVQSFIEDTSTISPESRECFKNQPFPCSLKVEDYPWTDAQLDIYKKDVTIPTGFPLIDKSEYKKFLGEVKMLKLYGIMASCMKYGHHAVLLRRMITYGFERRAKNDHYSVTKTTIYGVPVTIYTPTKYKVERRAGVFYIHGGGWVLGSSDEMEGVISKLAIDGDFVVFSVDYRLAPEHVFPAGFSDCVKTAKYFLRNANTYGVDGHRIAVMGDSSGGNLAAAVALRLRDINFYPKFKMQVLVYPALQAINFNTPSYQRNACDAYLDRPWMVEFWMWYALGNYPITWLPKLVNNGHTPRRIKNKYSSKIDISLLSNSHLNMSEIIDEGSEMIWSRVRTIFQDPYFAPLMASTLRDLPDSYMMLASQDVLHDEGELYAKRLHSDGVPVHVDTWQSLHALVDDPSVGYAATAIRKMTDYMRLHMKSTWKDISYDDSSSSDSSSSDSSSSDSSSDDS